MTLDEAKRELLAEVPIGRRPEALRKIEGVCRLVERALMERAATPHPKRAVLDQIWYAGHTPRLLIDAMHADVALPKHVKEIGKGDGDLVVIDLRASDPLEAVFDGAGVSVTLAFKGLVERCVFPWNSIRTIIDRESGWAVTFPDHTPDTAPAPQPSLPEPPKMGLRLIKGDKA